jgi:hypothetical protein
MSVSPLSVSFDDASLWAALSDGRTLGVPLEWFPRLLHAGPEARAAVTLSPLGLHWGALDEDISVAGLLAGRGDMGGVGKLA